MTERDEWMEQVVSSLSEEASSDPRAKERLRQAIHNAPAPAAWPLKLARWLVRAQEVRISPLAVFVGAVCFLALLVGVGRQSSRIKEMDHSVEAALLPVVEGPHRVRFSVRVEAATHVAVVGDFNDWDPRATPLHQTGSGRLWSTVAPLEPGRYLYAYVVNGRIWEGVDYALQAPEDEFGRRNSVVLVGNGPW